VNGIDIVHQSRRRDNAAKEDNCGHNQERDLIMPPRTRLRGRDDIDCRIVLLICEFLHWGNTAIPPILPAANSTWLRDEFVCRQIEPA
jgi:hypothetical protein